MTDRETHDRELPDPFRIAEWTVHPSLNRLRSGERTERIEPRLMLLLVRLARRPGRVVTRDELLSAVWGDAVVSEESLTRAVSGLRQVLGDDPHAPRFIETIRQGGYRLIAEVGDAADTDDPECRCWNPPPEMKGRFPLAAWFALLAFGVAIVAVLAWWRGREAPPASSMILGIPLTSLTGSERFPALSPDGRRVAYAASDGDDEGEYDLYVKPTDDDAVLRLTDRPGIEIFPTWSPGGDRIAYAAWGEECGIYVVSSLGGAPRLLVSTEGNPYGVDWSPDGRTIVFSAAEGEEPLRLRRLDVASGAVRTISEPPPGSPGDRDPAFAPDGESIAFTRLDDAFFAELMLMPAAGGKAHPLTEGQRVIAGITWSPDGRDVIFSACPTSEYGLWRVRADGGSPPRWVATRANRPIRPDVSAGAGGRLVFEEHAFDKDVWRLDLEVDGGPRAEPWIASTRSDWAATYAPSGDEIVFLSNRSGTTEIWTCDRDGGSLRRVTDFGGTYIIRPRFSPDGERIAFSAIPEGRLAVYVIDARGGVPRRLSSGERHEEFTAWSADGRQVYYFVFVKEGLELGAIDVETGKSRVVAAPGCNVARANEDGSVDYYRPGENEIRRMHPDGTEETLVPSDVATNLGAFCGVPGAVCFVRRRPGGAALFRYDYAAARTDSLAFLDRFSGYLLGFSPDGRYVLYDHAAGSGSDLILVNSFK